MSVALICIDVDGTLLDSRGEIPSDALAAIRRMRASGMRFALASGRPAFGLTLDYAQHLDTEGWHIFQNGASIMRPATGETNSVGLPDAVVEELIERGKRLRRPLELYSDHEYVTEMDCDRTRRHAELLGVAFRTRSFSELSSPIVRAQWLVAHADAASVLAEPHPALNACPSEAPLMPDTTFINMTAEGVDKGSALRSLAASYGLVPERVMMIGDGNNDIGALRAAGISVAMGNASADCIAAARFKVAHVDEGGLLEALNLAERV